MRIHHITLGIAVLLLTGLVSTATAGDQHRNENKAETKALPWRAELSGSFINTQSDTNKDGNKGGTNDGGFKSTIGPGTFQGVNEFAPSGTGTCPNGNPGFMATLLPGTGHGVYRFDRIGDLLFNEFSATICFDPITTIQFYSGTENFTGGTGRFTGATGSTTVSGTARTLVSDEAGNYFGGSSVTSEGTINAPNAGNGNDD